MYEKSVAFYNAFHDRVKNLNPIISETVHPKLEQLDYEASDLEDEEAVDDER